MNNLGMWVILFRVFLMENHGRDIFPPPPPPPFLNISKMLYILAHVFMDKISHGINSVLFKKKEAYVIENNFYLSLERPGYPLA